MQVWNRYWFAPQPLLDLAIVRVLCCLATLFYCAVYHNNYEVLLEAIALDSELFRPVFLFKVLHSPLGWGYSGSGGVDGLGVWAVRPSASFVQIAYVVFIVSGILSAIGLFTNFSLLIFASSFFYVQSYIYSFGDFHHPEAVMVFMLGALALSPAGGVLSVDNALRARRNSSNDTMIDASFAGWPIRFGQWFFVLMYLSAFWAKMSIGGVNWMNGYTLQFYLIQDGLRWNRDLALFISQFHWLIVLISIVVLVFQATFVLEIIYPRLRWIYIPLGLMLHTSIYILLAAPFFTWIALYSIFIPWRDAVLLFRRQLALRAGSA